MRPTTDDAAAATTTTTTTITTTLCSRKKRTKFETLLLEIIRIDFDEIWQKYEKYARIDFARFSLHVEIVGLLFINVSSLKPDTEINANFDAASSKRADFDEVQFFKTYLS